MAPMPLWSETERKRTKTVRSNQRTAKRRKRQKKAKKVLRFLGIKW